MSLPPEIPLQVGRLAISVARFEGVLHLAFSVLLDDDGTKTEAILSRIDSIQYKLDVIFGLAAHSTHPVAVQLLNSKSVINEAIAFRNIVSHCMFSTNEEDGSVHILRNAFRLKSKMSHEPFTADQPKRHADLLEDVSRKLAGLMDGHGIAVRSAQAPKNA